MPKSVVAINPMMRQDIFGTQQSTNLNFLAHGNVQIEYSNTAHLFHPSSSLYSDEWRELLGAR